MKDIELEAIDSFTLYADSRSLNSVPDAWIKYAFDNFEVSLYEDTTAPTVTLFSISDSDLIAGETAEVSLKFSESVKGFDSSEDINVENGYLSKMTSTDNINWTGIYTPNKDIEDSNNTLELNSNWTDQYGNKGERINLANFTIDTKTPEVTTFKISDTILTTGEKATVNLVFSEEVQNFKSSEDITVSNGYLSDMTSADNISWTGLFTPNSDTDYSINKLSLTSNWNDKSGNPGQEHSTDTFIVDSRNPSIIEFKVSDNFVTIGEKADVSFRFSEPIRNFSSNDDIEVSGGNLSLMTSEDQIFWTGIFTPYQNHEGFNYELNIGESWNDLAGNQGASHSSNSFSVDTASPTIENFTIDHKALKKGASASIHLVFSEPIKEFIGANDIITQHGELSSISTKDSITWTGIFEASKDIFDTQSLLQISTMV